VIDSAKNKKKKKVKDKDTSEYAKLYSMYKKECTSGAQVLRSFEMKKIPGPAVQKTQRREPPRVQTDLDKQFRGFAETMSGASDTVLAFLSLHGISMSDAVGSDFSENLRSATQSMEDYMRRVLSEDTLLGLNNVEPSQLLSENTALLESMLGEHTQILDTFLNYTLNVSENMEENELLKEEQIMELASRYAFTHLSGQEPHIDQKPVLGLMSSARARGQRRGEGIQKKSVQRREQKKHRETVLSQLRKPVVSLFQIPAWAFRALTPSATESEITQSNSVLQSVAGYARVLSDVTQPDQRQDWKVEPRKARQVLRSLEAKGLKLSDLRTKQLLQSDTFWGYALQRFRSFIGEEAVSTLLPGLAAMIIQSGAGYVMTLMNQVTAAESATARMREELQKIPAESVEEQRRFALKLYLEQIGEQLDETNIHSYLEKLRGVENKSEQELNVRLAYESWRELTKDLQQRLVDLPSPFIDVDAHLRIIRSDKVLELSSVDRTFYAQNRELLNEFASRYTGEIVPVTEIIGDVRLESLLYQDQVDRLPGAAAFLDNRVKLLHMVSSVSEVQDASEQGADLWATSQEVATDVLLDTPNQVLTQVASFQALGITGALHQVSGTAIPDRQPSAQELSLAKHKLLAEAIAKATDKYIRRVSEPIPTDSLRETAAELNKDAAWEALGSMLIRGSNNTVLNNLILSILASISKALTRATLMHLLNQFPALLSDTIRNSLTWIPRMSSAVFRYGIVSHMLGLAVAHGLIGTTNILEEWDVYMDAQVEQMGGILGTAQRKAILAFMRGLRWTSVKSLNVLGYVNRNSMVGWMSFAVLVGLHGSLQVYQTLTGSITVAAFQTAIQSSGLIVMAGTEGVLHSILSRYMLRYIEERRRVVEAANRPDAPSDVLVSAQTAQSMLYMTPIFWAMWGSAITVSLNAARLLMSADSSLWNTLFQADLPAAAIGQPRSLEQVPAFIHDLEVSLTGSADYSTRYTFISAVNAAISAAASKRP